MLNQVSSQTPGDCDTFRQMARLLDANNLHMSHISDRLEVIKAEIVQELRGKQPVETKKAVPPIIEDGEYDEDDDEDDDDDKAEDEEDDDEDGGSGGFGNKDQDKDDDFLPPQAEAVPLTLKQKLKRQIHLRRTNKTRSSAKFSKKNRKIHKLIHRICTEHPDGTKVTKESEQLSSESTEEKSSFLFETEEQIHLFVKEDTKRYEDGINNYANNTSLVFSSLEKWYDQLGTALLKEQCPTDLTIETLLYSPSAAGLPKDMIIQWQLFKRLWSPQTKIPVLKSIIFYTINPYPDGNRKEFHCQFSDSVVNKEYIDVVVPEILLRAIPNYRDTIQAFFHYQFIPFKKAFMNECRLQRLLANSKVEEEISTGTDEALDRIDQAYTNPAYPSIDHRVCFVRSASY
jgi:hypothetical protein